LNTFKGEKSFILDQNIQYSIANQKYYLKASKDGS